MCSTTTGAREVGGRRAGTGGNMSMLDGVREPPMSRIAIRYCKV